MKIVSLATGGALLLATVIPAFASFSMPSLDLNGQVVYTQNSNFAQSNTGENSQMVMAKSESGYGGHRYSYCNNGCGSPTLATANMTTGNATSTVNSETLVNAYQGGGSGMMMMDRHHSSGSGLEVNLQGVATLGENQALSNTGMNEQYGMAMSKGSSMTGATANMTTGNANSNIRSTTTVYATNVSRMSL